jgi:type II secretory pathway component PulL
MRMFDSDEHKSREEDALEMKIEAKTAESRGVWWRWTSVVLFALMVLAAIVDEAVANKETEEDQRQQQSQRLRRHHIV